MPTQSCFSLRPGTLFGYKGRTWKVLSNDTLAQVFRAKTIPSKDELFLATETKSFRYSAGQVIQIRWKPFSNSFDD